jgi:heme o synthase
MKAEVLEAAPSVQKTPAITAQMTGDRKASLISKARDYLSLTKPRIIIMAQLAVGAGSYVAAKGQLDFALFLHTIFGVTLAAAASFVLNQLLETKTDAQMIRTQNRPLPAGRISSLGVLIFGIVLAAVGLVYLGLFVNAMTAFVTSATFASYVFVYTPLKRYTTWNTLVGALPGALPPAIGWVAVTGSMDAGAWLLFAIVFLWQFPHFFAIAWIYREDYSRAGLKMLTVEDKSGAVTCRQMLLTCAALLPVSLCPTLLGLTGTAYLVGAILLGLFYATYTILFVVGREKSHAKNLFRASLVYLPSLFLLLSLDLVSV